MNYMLDLVQENIVHLTQHHPALDVLIQHLIIAQRLVVHILKIDGDDLCRLRLKLKPV